MADEVRKLAERTGAARKEIAGMVVSIQKESQEAVQAMQRGSGEVESGIALAGEARQALTRVVGEASGVLDQVTQIASARGGYQSPGQGASGDGPSQPIRTSAQTGG